MSNCPVITSLGGLLLGSAGIVAERTANNVARRRFVDLGLIPDQEAVLSAPLDDPVEYFLLDPLVTLRCRDARHVLIDSIP